MKSDEFASGEKKSELLISRSRFFGFVPFASVTCWVFHAKTVPAEIKMATGAIKYRRRRERVPGDEESGLGRVMLVTLGLMG